MTTITRKSGAARREEIVQAVLRIIDGQGIRALTTTTVSREIGVTSGALFRHFDTRDEILRETVRYVASRVEGSFPDDSLPGDERLRRLAENRVELLVSEPGIAWFLHSDQAALALPSDAVALLEGCARRSRSFVLAALEDGVAARTIRDDVDPEHLLVMVMGTIHAFVGRRGAKRKHDASAVVSALMRVIAP
jgi:AcrR family transcriptional regulator